MSKMLKFNSIQKVYQKKVCNTILDTYGTAKWKKKNAFKDMQSQILYVFL